METYTGSTVIEAPGGRNWKTLVIPTANDAALPLNNEYVLDSRRVGTGYKGFNKVGGPHDYGVGTTLINSGDGCILRDPDGNNPTTVLGAGMVREHCNWVHDKANRKYSHEFILENTDEKNSATVVDACDTTTNFSVNLGTGTVALDTTDRVEGTGSMSVTSGQTDANGDFRYHYAMPDADWSGHDFLVFAVKSSINGELSLLVEGDILKYKKWEGSRFAVTADTWTTFVIPLKSPVGTTGATATEEDSGWNIENIINMFVGIKTASASSTIEFNVDDICLDVGKWCQIETMVPDKVGFLDLGNNATDKYKVHAWNGSSWREMMSWDSQTRLGLSNDSWLLDQSKFGDIYGAINTWTCPGITSYYQAQRSEIPVKMYGIYGELPPVTAHSDELGTNNRIKTAYKMPPSDNGRTEINKTKLKLEVYYDDENGNTVPDLSGMGNHGTIVGGVTKGDGYIKATNGSIQMFNDDRYVTNDAELELDITLDDVTSSDNYLAFMSGNAIILKHDANVLKLYVANSNDDILSYATAYTGLEANTRYKIAVRYLNGEVDLLIDGEIVYSASLSDYPLRYNNGAPNSYLIGFWDGSHRFDGKLHEVSFVSDSEQILSYKPTITNMGATTHEISLSETDIATSLKMMHKPWIAMIDEDNKLVDYMVMTKKPTDISYTTDENGNIVRIAVDVDESTTVFRDKIYYSNILADKDSDNIPDSISEGVDALAKHMDFVYEYLTKLTLNPSIVTNDFGLTLDECKPYYWAPAGAKVEGSDHDTFQAHVGRTLINSGDGFVLNNANGDLVGTELSKEDVLADCNWTLDEDAGVYSLEYEIENTNLHNDSVTFHSCDSLTDVYNMYFASASLDTDQHVEGTGCIRIECNGTNSQTRFRNSTPDLTGYDFITFDVKLPPTISGIGVYLFTSEGDADRRYVTIYPGNDNTWKHVVMPINVYSAAAGTFDISNVVSLRFDASGEEAGDVYYVDNIRADKGKWVYVESMVPDELLDTVKYAHIHTWNGTSFDDVLRWNDAGANGSTNGKMMDGTEFGQMYAGVPYNGYGITCFRDDLYNTVATRVFGQTLSMTYTSTEGADNRLGYAVILPPSDNGRTGINKVKLKQEVHFTPNYKLAVPTATGNVVGWKCEDATELKIREHVETAGDVKVFDTMGSDIEANWIRVYNPDHIFVGDPIIENGLVRMRADMNYKIRIYANVSGTWTVVSSAFTRNGGGIGFTMTDAKLVSVSGDRVELQTIHSVNGLVVTSILERGRYCFDMSLDANGEILYEGEYYRFGVGSNTFIDSVDIPIASAAWVNYSDGQWGILFDPDKDVLQVSATPVGVIRSWVTNTAQKIVDHSISVDTTASRFYGGIPFDKTKLYSEADTDMTGGEVI